MPRPSQRISIRQLHERTGHYVRESSTHRVIITDRGEPIAEITPLAKANPELPYFARRKLTAAYEQHAASGAYRARRGDSDLTTPKSSSTLNDA